MKSRFLFPHKFRVVGVVTLIIGIAANIVIYNFLPAPSGSQVNSITAIISTFSGACPAVILGLLIIGFSKEKIEDEQIAQLRLDSLHWAIYLNYFILITCFFSLRGIGLLSIVTFNLLTPIVFFIARFRWLIYCLNQSLKQDI